MALEVTGHPVRSRSRVARTPVGDHPRESRGPALAAMQRRRLLRAFLEVVADGGVQAASIERVCGRAGVSRRTFYEVFADAEDCYLMAVERLLEQISGDLSPVLSKDAEWRVRMREALMVVLARLDAEPGAARMLIAETVHAGPVVLERRARVLEGLARAVDEGRQEAVGRREAPSLAAQAIVGALLHVVQSRLEADPLSQLSELVGELMAIVVMPYLGVEAAAEEVDRSSTGTLGGTAIRRVDDPFKDLPIRFTYRTALVLESIAAHSGANNRQVAERSGIGDQGQVSRLLTRLHRAGLIANARERASSAAPTRGDPNAWSLTERGHAVHAVLNDA